MSDPRAIALREHLEALPRQKFPVLIPEVKKAVGLDQVSRKVWRTTVDHALEGTEFEVDTKYFRLASDLKTAA